MDEVRMDATAVGALARGVLESADRIDVIDWPTMDSTDLAGSAVARAARNPALPHRLTDVTAHMRRWATAARESAVALDSADLRHARQLGNPR